MEETENKLPFFKWLIKKGKRSIIQFLFPLTINIASIVHTIRIHNGDVIGEVKPQILFTVFMFSIMCLSAYHAFYTWKGYFNKF